MKLPDMKSRVTRVYDFRKTDLSEFIPRFKADDEELSRALMLYRKKHAVPTEAEAVQRDDFVTLSCRSENKRFNKPSVTVRVGKGLFSRELEEDLVGLAADTEKEICIKGEKVFVRILKIVRNIIPELCDEVVASWGLDGIRTVKELKNSIISSQREAYINDTAEGMAGEVQRLANEKSEFVIDENELAVCRAEARAMLWNMLKGSGVDPDNDSDEKIKELTGMTLSEHIAFIEGVYTESFKSSLVSRELIKQNGIEFGEDDYRKALAEQASFMEISEDEAKKDFTFDVFVRQRIGDRYFELVEEHIKKYLSE